MSEHVPAVPAVLNDPLYLGNRHARVRGAAYDAFIEKYLETAASLFPGALTSTWPATASAAASSMPAVTFDAPETIVPRPSPGYSSALLACPNE